MQNPYPLFFTAANTCLFAGISKFLQLGEREPLWLRNTVERNQEAVENIVEKNVTINFLITGVFFHGVGFALSSERDWSLNGKGALVVGSAITLITAAITAQKYWERGFLLPHVKSGIAKAAFVAAAQFALGSLTILKLSS